MENRSVAHSFAFLFSSGGQNCGGRLCQCH